MTINVLVVRVLGVSSWYAGYGVVLYTPYLAAVTGGAGALHGRRCRGHHHHLRVRVSLCICLCVRHHHHIWGLMVSVRVGEGGVGW